MLSKPMATKLAHDLYELAGDKNFLAEAKFLLELAEKHREGALPAILREYVELAKEDKRNLLMADVTTAMREAMPAARTITAESMRFLPCVAARISYPLRQIQDAKMRTRF